MYHRGFIVILICFVFCAMPAGAAPTPGAPAPLSGMEDHGAFTTLASEEKVMTSTFRWSPDGSVEATTVLSVGGQSVTTRYRILPDADGRFRRVTADSPGQSLVLTRQGTTIRRVVRDPVTGTEKIDTIPLESGAVFFDSSVPALASQAIRRYRGGRQRFPVLSLSGELVRGTLERLGADRGMARYRLSLPGVEVTLLADSRGRICLVGVPQQHAVIVRDGYEALLKASRHEDPLLSKPAFKVRVERGLMCPMRDGVRLATDVYRPDAAGRFPVILIRTPYKKDNLDLKGHYWARRGYVCAIQDCRGRFGSGGVWEPFIHEADDGYDAIEWLAGQPWSSGKVGMIGGSYVGWVQWWAASRRPPHLVTIIPNVSPPDPLYNLPYENGVFFLTGDIWWGEVVASGATADISGAAIRRISEKMEKYPKLLRALPVIDLDRTLMGGRNPFWRAWIRHGPEDRYWDPACFDGRLDRVRIPVFHESGWFDGDGIGTKINYLKMRACGHAFQKLVIGPWGHSDQAMRMVDGRDFGPGAIVDLQREYLRWFDRWLKGVDNHIDREPLVSVFVMGSNRWLHGDRYPLPQTRFEKWYLESRGGANTSAGDGRISTRPPRVHEPADCYLYDPDNPTPTPSTDFMVEPNNRSTVEKERLYKAYHGKVTRTRRDILVYDSGPLRRPLTILGPLSAVLWASSSARDTDWFMRLVDVEPSGGILTLAEGKVRARYRRSMKDPRLLTPGKAYRYNLDLWQTGITLARGHRLRVEVASASFPMFSRNLNTGGNNETGTRWMKARQAIYHDRAHRSYVLLPVVPMGR